MSNRLKRRPDHLTRPTAECLARRLGLLRSRDLEAHGIPHIELRLRAFREVAPGVWARKLDHFDATTIAAKRVTHAVICLQSALWFHRLLSKEPANLWLAIGEHARRPRWDEPRLRVVRFSGAALSEGIEHHVVSGVPVRVYSIAKTVADLFKYRNKLGYAVAVQALRNALLSGRCSEEEVLRFAALCRVTKTLAPYLDVLQARYQERILTAAAFARAEADRIRREAPLLDLPPDHP